MSTRPAIREEQAIGALLRTQFTFFLRYAFREIGGVEDYDHNWHIDALDHRLNLVRSGSLRRLVITMPPRHLKSIAVTIAWVAWMLGRYPALRFVCVSYGQDLADKHARDCLRIMESDWFKMAFPACRLTRRAAEDFETTAGGGRLATSVTGALTGRGANFIILDDPLKADGALSETARAAAKEWFNNTLLSRLDSQVRGGILLVMQRLHEDDLAGELLRNGGWDELRLSAIADGDECIAIGPDTFYQRLAGHALHPSRQPLAVLEEIRQRNSFVFAAQYQQDPVPRLGNIVNPSWFARYAEPPTSGVVVQSWDTAVKTGVRNDWSAGITAIYYMKRFYILDVFRERVSFGALRAAVIERCRRFAVERLLIEDASSGAQLIQLLRDFPVENVVRPIAVAPTSDKTSRFEAQATHIEAGAVVLPQAAPWLADFIAEIAAIPGGRHDDQGDALAQMLANPPPLQPAILNAGPMLICEDDELDTTWPPSEQPDADPWSGL